MAETVDDGGDRDALTLGSDVAAAAAGASIGLVGGPIGSIAGAVAAPAIKKGVQSLFEWHARRQWERVEHLIQLAAKVAGVDGSELIERMKQDPDREELLVRTVRAAADASVERKLVALAKSLAATSTGNLEQVRWEGVFVRALADLDEVHVHVLERFTWSAKALGLGDGDPGFDAPMGTLNSAQMSTAFPGLEEVLGAILATLVRDGLLAFATHTLTTYGGGSPAPPTWTLSPFGRAVLTRLGMIADVLHED